MTDAPADPDWRRLPSLSALRAFEAASRLGGFSAAARVLNVTHAAVSQAVRGLEAELGVRLLDRDGRGLRLTGEGARLARSLREGFATVAAGVEALRAAEGRRGLRLTCTPAFAQTVLLPRLDAFWRLHPDLALSIHPSLEVADLGRDGFDLAIRSGGGAWPGLEAEPLLEARMLVAAAPALLAREPDPLRLPWLLDADDRQERAWLAALGLDRDRLATRPLDSPLLALPAAVAGLGVIIASDAVARADLAAGRLVELELPRLPGFTYWLVTPPGPRRPAVARFAAWLRASLRAGEGAAVSRETAPRLTPPAPAPM